MGVQYSKGSHFEQSFLAISYEDC